MAELAHHLIDLYLQNKTDEFEAVFYIIEDLHLYGTNFVKEAVTVGFLESLQNICSHRTDIDGEIFKQYLHPVSLKCWNKLYE